MKRREFVTLLGGAATWPLAARAQQPERVRRIGVLMNLPAEDAEGQARVAAFVAGLRESGWTDGRNLRVDTRWGGGDANRIRRDAAELVALCVLPATRPEGWEVRALVGPRIVIETRPRPALGRLLLPARLSGGVSIHCRLWLGGFGAGIRSRGVRHRRLDHGRLDTDDATRPAEFVGPSARCRDIFIRAQPNGRPRTFAGSS